MTNHILEKLLTKYLSFFSGVTRIQLTTQIFLCVPKLDFVRMKKNCGDEYGAVKTSMVVMIAMGVLRIGCARVLTTECARVEVEGSMQYSKNRMCKSGRDGAARKGQGTRAQKG